MTIKRFLVHFLICTLCAYQLYQLKLKYQSKSVNKDSQLAIARAKSLACKQELTLFSQKADKNLHRPILTRTCRLDKQVERVKIVGLICDINDIDGSVTLEGAVESLDECLQLCFSYGHSHGGYNQTSSSCSCGDGISADETSSRICRTTGLNWYQVDHGLFRPRNGKSRHSEDKSLGKPLRILFLLIVRGRAFNHILRLLRNLYSNVHIYYIHVDSRDSYLYEELVNFTSTISNVIIAKQRYSTIWGSPLLLNVILECVESVSDLQWDYLINLSESDFPIKTVTELQDHLSKRRGLIFLKGHGMKGYDFIRKQGFERYFFQCDDRLWKIGPRKLPLGIVYSGGSDWLALPRDFCSHVMNSLNNTKSFVSPLREFYNYSLLAVESFFHTVAINGEFCDSYVNDNLRISNWNRKQGCKCQHKDIVDWCGCSPLVFRSSDWKRLNKTRDKDLFFARKFDPTISSSIITFVEQNLLRRQSKGELERDTRYWQRLVDSKEVVAGHMERFGLLGLSSSKIRLTNHESRKIRTIDIFFNEDRFVGWIYRFCSDKSACIQILIKTRTAVNVHQVNGSCLQEDGFSLNAIEVNHGFDTIERVFKDFRPLSRYSDIIVYHDWKTTEKTSKQIKFSWTKPEGSLAYNQSVKLTPSAVPSRLATAHRLNFRGPLIPGVWKLGLSHRNIDCLLYSFLIIDDSKKQLHPTEQTSFLRFYETEYCLEASMSNDHHEHRRCGQSYWSLSDRRDYSVFD